MKKKAVLIMIAAAILYYQLKPALDNQRETNKVIAAEKAEHDQIFERRDQWKRRRDAATTALAARVTSSGASSVGGSGR